MRRNGRPVLFIRLVHKFSHTSFFSDVLNYIVSATGNDGHIVSIMNMDGRIIQQVRGNTNKAISVEVAPLKAGTYLLDIHNNRTGERVVKEFLKK